MTQLGPEAQAIEDSLVRQAELLDAWVHAGDRLGAIEAERVELLAARLDLLARDRLSGDEVAFRSMCAEYAAAGHVSPGVFAGQIADAWMLARTLPVTFEALRAGRISKRHADVIVTAAPNVSGCPDADLVRAEYEERVVPFAESETAARTRAHARGVAAAVFPVGMVLQHRRARSERAVMVRADGDGMAVLTAILPEILAYAIHDRLTRMGGEIIQSRPAGQRRPRRSTLEKIRAERDVALAGQLPSLPEGPVELEAAFAARIDRDCGPVPPWQTRAESGDDEAGVGVEHAAVEDEFTTGGVCIDESNILDQSIAISDSGAGPFHDSVSTYDLPMHDGYGPVPYDMRTMDQLRADLLSDLLLTTTPSSVTETALESINATVQVTIAADSLETDNRMAELNSHGPLDPDAARILAGHASSWDRVFLDPKGMVTQTDNYVPTPGMKRYLKARDQHCRFPGCRTPAHRCQIDHNYDHALGGPTAVSNLALFCTSHHPLKHPDVDDRDRWTAKQLDGGVILWQSPLGRTYTDEPPLRVMFS